MKKDISIVLSGAAGKGIKTLEQLLIKTFLKAGYYLFSSKEIMSRIRGGNNTTEIRIANYPVSSFSERIDILIPLNANALYRLEERITKNTLILGEKEYIEPQFEDIGAVCYLEIIKAAREAGSGLFTNTIILGLVTGFFGIDERVAGTLLDSRFSAKGEQIIEKNRVALKLGIGLSNSIDLNRELPEAKNSEYHYLLNGTEALSIGAIAGGCNFVSAYPMSPATGVLQFLAYKAGDFDIALEQAEDEISAINMAIGAWYTGARGFTTTSGGGFALMEEGISLSGGTETPVVVHIGQRPGPATGLPTRTEQGDFNLAVYSGHGDFPRIVLAPRDAESAVEIGKQAFELADRYQIPVIILTDQYLLDSYFASNIKLTEINHSRHFIKTENAYKRYVLTESGISPRGIPGYGSGFVCCDSDEHTEEGRITEDFKVRTAMVDKRLKKLDLIERESSPAEVFGDPGCESLIVSWGSTYGAVKEAFENLGLKKTAFVNLTQVFPLQPNISRLMEQAGVHIIIENNATGQLGEFIRQKTGIGFEYSFLKYNGMTFSVEEVREKLENLKNKGVIA